MDKGAMSKICDPRRQRRRNSCYNTERTKDRTMKRRSTCTTGSTSGKSATWPYKMQKRCFPNIETDEAVFASKQLEILTCIKEVKMDLISHLLSQTPRALFNLEVRDAVLKSENLDIIDLYINHRMAFDGEHEEAETAVHRAILVKYPECFKIAVFKMFLRNGVFIYCKNRKGQTVLHLAAERGYVELITTLLEYNPYDYYPGQVSTLELRQFGYRDMAVHLHAKNNMGETVLHVASKGDQREVVEILLKHGIDVDCRTIEDKTALKLTMDYYQFDTFRVLRNYAITANHDEIERYGILCKLSDTMKTKKAYNRDCNAEIATMKQDKIAKNLSVYDVVQKSAKQLAVYTNNINTVKSVLSVDWKARYPIFGYWIKYNFRRAQLRERLMTIGSNSFHCTINRYIPPQLVNQILEYLESEELVNFIEACKP